MISYPNAKINLGLHIMGKRNDGYHDVEGVLYPLILSDVLEVIEFAGASGDSFTTSGLQIPCREEDNLCIRALHLLRADFSFPPTAIHLHKIIPSGAGLGGGSSDAIFLLKSVISLFELPVSRKSMMLYASKLGSDCSFFIDNTPAAVSGRGDELFPLDINLKGYHCAVVHPAVFISTANAYASVSCREDNNTMLANIIASTPIEEWRGRISNDFEKYAISRDARIGEIIDSLYGAGALFASLSGSGSASFGIFDKEPDLSGLFDNCFVWTGGL
ncbi:MAG: 4-(cytidine 5'-diphospho)-2-C-methyl-D-erythritol kinase [Flavobacteriales bacterium]